MNESNIFEQQEYGAFKIKHILHKNLGWQAFLNDKPHRILLSHLAAIQYMACNEENYQLWTNIVLNKSMKELHPFIIEI